MSTNAITVVLFDVGGVIIRAAHRITEVILEDLGITPEGARRFFANEHYAAFSRGEISVMQFHENIVKFHITPADYDTLPRLDYQTVRQAHDAHLYGINEAILSRMEALTAANISVHAITDTNPWQTRRECALIDLQRHVGLVFRSHELHGLKRERGMLEHVLEQLGEDPARVLLVDADLVNIARADRLGMQIHHYTNVRTLDRALATYVLLR
ncbi:MAG: hypothetical protein Q7S96_02245 [bacterium]|nr:hypothetical protein [bacterium]